MAMPPDLCVSLIYRRVSRKVKGKLNSGFRPRQAAGQRRAGIPPRVNPHPLGEGVHQPHAVNVSGVTPALPWGGRLGCSPWKGPVSPPLGIACMSATPGPAFPTRTQALPGQKASARTRTARACRERPQESMRVTNNALHYRLTARACRERGLRSTPTPGR